MQNEELKKRAADLLDKIDTKSSSANEIINAYTKTHRYIEAEDRRALLQMIWSVIRAKARLAYAYPTSSWIEKITLLEEKGIPNVSKAPEHVRFEVPAWFLSHIPQPEQELPLFLEPAPIVLRANGKRDEVMAMLQEEGLHLHATEKSPYGMILEERALITETKAYKKGLVEVQDEGAQLLSCEIGIKPHDDVFDFCAGAGGKSLIFAQIMNNKGFIQAYDASPKRLSELLKRAHRSKASIIKTITRLPEPFKKFDYVVVDAPCSGTGTWRRSPDMRWKLTEKQLKNIVSKQAEILDIAEAYVKNGHYLVYITCSLTYDENEWQIAHFLQSHPGYILVREKRYSPWRTGTDGFYMCLLQKR